MTGTGLWQAIRLGPDRRPSGGDVIAEGPNKADVAHLWEPGRVVIAWTANEQPRRRLSPEGLASVRRKRLRRGLEKRYPLFAAQLYEAELAARPAYFAGESDQ